MKPSAREASLAGLLLVIVLAGCSTSHYRNSADTEVYRAIQGKTPLVSDMDRRFTIDYTNFLSLEGLPLATNIPDFLGPEGEHEPGAYILNLKDTLALAVEYSRNYQSQKET